MNVRTLLSPTSYARLFVGIFIFISLAFSLQSCRKDRLEPIRDKTSSTSLPLALQQMADTPHSLLETTQQWWDHQIQNIDTSLLHPLNPLLLEPDWTNGRYSSDGIDQRLNFTTMDVDAVPSHVSFTHVANGSIYVHAIHYFADQSYYEQHTLEANIIDFTGKILQTSTADRAIRVLIVNEGMIDQDYSSGRRLSNDWLSSVIEETDEETIQGLVDPYQEEPSHEDNGGCCCGAQCGGKVCGGCGSRGGGGGSGIPVYVLGGSYSSPWAGWTGGGWGNHGSENGDRGEHGGGGGSHTPERTCEQQNFWADYDLELKKDYLRATASLLAAQGVRSCGDPFRPNEPGCLPADELQCIAYEENCFQPFVGDPFQQGGFTECMVEHITAYQETEAEQEAETITCNQNALAFIERYALTGNDGNPMSILAFKHLIGGFFDGNGGNICGVQEDFDDQALQAIAENMDTCGSFDFIGCGDESVNKICPESFPFIPVGNNYTCDIGGIKFKYFGAFNKVMHIGDLCITVPKYDIEGNSMTAEEASNLLALAWHEAQALTTTVFANSNHTLTSAAYKNLFINSLRTTMLIQFSGTFGQGTMNVTNRHCSGSFPLGIPKYGC